MTGRISADLPLSSSAMTTPRKICVITGTRAEYGLLRWVMQGIKDAPELELQIIATGSHLVREFGDTYREIERDGFPIDRKVDMLMASDTPVGVAKSMGIALLGFADALADLSPDLIVVLGDRYEILAAVSAAMVARIPIAHLHGGETTEGAFDESIRHSLTKMSHLHFVAAAPYRDRVIQLGESPETVHLVGGLGVDAIKRVKLLDRAQLEASMDFRFGKRNLLVTFHPVTLESDSAGRQMDELFAALDTLSDTHVIFTLPNADTDGRALIRQVNDYVATRAHCRAYPSLGQLRYLSCIAQVDGVVGNSSSGIAEVPSFGKGTINIGDRQRGRLMADSVIQCAPERADIEQALTTLYSPAFQAALARTINPYGNGGASAKIVEVLKSVDLSNILKKSFYDLDVSGGPIER